MISQSEAAKQHTHTLDVVCKFFELMHRKEIDAWGELWNENGRIIVFYPPEGFGSSIDGKTEIREKPFAKMLAARPLSHVQLLEIASAGDLVVAKLKFSDHSDTPRSSYDSTCIASAMD